MSDRAMHNLELDDELVLLCDEAEAALSLGMVEQAAELFGRAARHAAMSPLRWALVMRRAHCLDAGGDLESAEELALAVIADTNEALANPDPGVAHTVTRAARADALSLAAAVASSLASSPRFARDPDGATELAGAAAEALSDALEVLAPISDRSASHHVLHHLGQSCLRGELTHPAISWLERALEVAANDTQRAVSQALLAVAHHLAAAQLMSHRPSCFDPDVAHAELADSELADSELADSELAEDRSLAEAHLQAGITAASAALDEPSCCDATTLATASAHRALMTVMLDHIGDRAATAGRGSSPLADSRTALAQRRTRPITPLTPVAALATAADALVRWAGGMTDPAALVSAIVGPMLDGNTEPARLSAAPFLAAFEPMLIDLLVAHGRAEQMRLILEQRIERTTIELRRERAVRWRLTERPAAQVEPTVVAESGPAVPGDNLSTGTLCVAIVDLDNFSRLHDDVAPGHTEMLLDELTGLLHRVCRRGDTVLNLGRDRFALVLADTSPDDARPMLERLRVLIANRSWRHLPSNIRVSASIGAAIGTDGVDTEHLFTTAEEAMLNAKRAGGDRVVFH
ncbi:MAG: GGDEF domain-containing protein [Actinomycetota bacterium]